MAVAGFAGIVGAIAKPKGDAARADLKALVAGAVGVLFFSLLPLIVSHIGVAEDILWRLVSVALALYVAWYYWINRTDFRIISSSPRWFIIAAGDLMMLIALVAVSMGTSFVGGTVVYLGSLLWILSQALVFFALAMAALWQDSSESPSA